MSTLENNLKDLLTYFTFVRDVERCTSRVRYPGLPSLQTMCTHFSYLWQDAPSQKEQYVKCMDGERQKVLV